MGALIVGIGQTPRIRHVDAAQTTMGLLRDAAQLALCDAGLTVRDIDGFAVASFSLLPDRAVDVAWRFGLSVRWLLEDINGGVSALNMLGHAIRGIDSGAARNILIVAGDVTRPEDFAKRAVNYNSSVRDHLAPLGHGGPNSMFAMLTQRQMRKYGLVATDYGNLVRTQRRWAADNPLAAYRTPLTMDEYLDAPVVAEPLRRYDCVPIVSAASALIVSADRQPGAAGDPVRVLAYRQGFNYDHQDGDGLQTGVRGLSGELWQAVGFSPSDMDVVSAYDDYPAVVLAQLADLGFVENDDIARFSRDKLAEMQFPVNTGGGMLSGGQAGHDGGTQGLVEVVRQLQHRGGDRQVADAELGVVSGYGMILYRYCAGAAAAVLQRVS